MSAAPVMQQPGSHPGSASGTPGPVGTPQPLQQPMSNPSMLMQQQQQQLQRPDPTKEKLIMSIHEYLVLHGAPKAAEALKSEMTSNFPNAKWATTSDPLPGFLANWWSLFYDLYCAAPERRNEPDLVPSTEAKFFLDFQQQAMQGGGFPIMNGMPPQFGGPGGMMGHDGMIPGFAARGFPGRGGGPPMGHPMAGSPFLGGYDPRMAGGGRGAPPMGAIPGRPQQMTPGSFPVAAMRGGPPPPHMQTQQMPPQGMYRGGPFIDGSGAPPGAFPNPAHGMGGMNGGVMGMGSPSMQPMQHPGGGPPPFMMMPTSSAPMPPFGAMSASVSSEGMTGPPSHPSQSANTPLGNGPASAGVPGTSGAPLSAGNAGVGGMMNGEMKNSPHTPRGNGGTPGAHGGPGSGAPGSVHSGAGSVPPPVSGEGITPKQEPMDTNHVEGDDSSREVEKIKASLISDFATTKDEMSADYSNYAISSQHQ